ncbi:MAG TPA: MarR family transcriptional regulator [Trebonia sp.]|nr:MarR family transcriptional regulator [Trebonia sp.]
MGEVTSDQVAPDTMAEKADEDSIALAGAVYGLLASLLRRAPRDISLTSLATLSTLDRTGTKRITELAAIEGVTQPSMTTLVASLERQGLVERRGDPGDRRVSLVSLTEAGREYMLRRRRAGTEAFATLVAQLPAAEAAALAAAIPALDRLRDLDNALRDATIRARA